MQILFQMCFLVCNLLVTYMPKPIKALGIREFKEVLQQRTIRKSISWTGIGLHSGKVINVTLHPAPAGHGIIFERTDIPGRPRVKATYDNVIATELASTVGTNGVRVSTVEHLLAALYGMGIDNILIELNGDEVPIMDGSAEPFVKILRTAGIKKLARGKKFFIIKKSVSVRDDNRWISVTPGKEFRIFCTIEYPHPAIGRQEKEILVSSSNFAQEISRARTFGFMEDVLAIQAKGLARGGGLHNAVVLDGSGVVNSEGLRFPDEFVRHKILDIIGDFALLGGPLIGNVQAFKTGHELNNKLVKRILADPSIYEVATFEQPEEFIEGEPEEDTWKTPQWALI